VCGKISAGKGGSIGEREGDLGGASYYGGGTRPRCRVWHFLDESQLRKG